MDVLIGWPGGDWQATLQIVGAIVGGYLFVLWISSVLWVYKDIRSRSRDMVTQATAVGIGIVFPVVGLPVYLVLRPSERLIDAYARRLEQEAILSDLHSISACPTCRRPIEEEFTACPHCATSLKSPCAHCSRPLQFSWRNCPYCATPRARPSEAAVAASAPPPAAAHVDPAAPPSAAPSAGASGAGQGVRERLQERLGMQRPPEPAPESPTSAPAAMGSARSTND